MHPKSIVRHVLAVAFALATGTAAGQRLETGLVAYYPLDGNLAEATDVVGTAVARGTLEYDSGAIGRAAKLSGDDEIDFNGIPNATFGGNFTVSWFMNLTAGGDRHFFGKQSTCGASNHFTTNLGKAASAEDLSFILSSATDSGVATGTIRLKTWVHVAVVRDGARASVFVDGRPGALRNLPALSLGAITAPFGLGNSPCVGTFGPNAVGRPIGRFDEVRVYNVALAADVIADLAKRPVFSATPNAASPQGRTDVRASQLVVGRTYALRLTGPVDRQLFSGPATKPSMTWPVTIPSIPGGSYRLQLTTSQLRVTTVERELPFTVLANLTIAPSASLQAGKKATFTIGNLAPGSVRLLYAGRVVAGPAIVVGASHTFALALPSDIPASLPATVAVRAELLSGRTVSRIGSANVSVAAPFTGRFVTMPGFVSSLATAKPSEPVRVTGSIALADGARNEDVELSAYWVGDNGDVTPLPTESLALDVNGNVRLDTRPPSLGAMTAFVPRTAGRIRLVAKRENAFGRVEWVVEEGPRFATIYDVDADTDITVNVRERRSGGSTVALEGAFVVLDSAAPVGYDFDPPSGAGGGSGAPIGGNAILRHRQPGTGIVANPTNSTVAKGSVVGAAAAVNQVNSGQADLPPPPPPACGENLYRRYTDAQGRASFPILGGPEEAPGNWQNVVSQVTEAVECSGVQCGTAQALQRYEFFVTVYTLHLGSGERAPFSNAEVPTRFHIEYDRAIEQFRIRNLRTNTVTTQNVSANLIVEVTPFSGSDNFITISDPLMYHEIGNQPISLVGKLGNDFGHWVDFSGTRVSHFVNPAPDRVMQFGHKPDANGSIVSAKLYLNNLNGTPTSIGDFQQVSFVEGCNLQENASSNGTETWRLKVDPNLAISWRFPQGVLFNQGAERKACGYVEVKNASGGSGRRNLCLNWQAAPGFMYDDGGDLRVNDADMHEVQIERQGETIDERSTVVPKRQAQLLGETVDEPGRIENSSNSNRGLYSVVNASGESGGFRKFAGNNPTQFSKGAAGTDDDGAFPAGENSIEIGDAEYQTVFDQSIPLFQWYWGVPEVLSAEVYAKLRLIAQYLFTGTLTRSNDGEKLDLRTSTVFGALILIGVDIDVLFGLIVDAGASLTGAVISELTTEVVDNQVQSPSPCITFAMQFDAYVDPCPLCPTPIIPISEPILNEKVPENCSFYSLGQGGSDFAKGAIGTRPRFGFAEARTLRRHTALAYDAHGNGQMLSLGDDRSLTVREVDNGALSPAFLLSTAYGARDAQIAYFDADRAVAVWAENALSGSFFTTSDYVTIARNQRLAWAEWDGDSWSDKRILTPPGKGEGQIGLTACPDGGDDCPAGGEVIAVWQRDENASATNPQYRLFHSRFRPATGFGAVSSLDTTPSTTVDDISPSVAYLNGLPVVVWTRQFGGSLDDFQQRNLAYRVLPAGNVGVVAAAPGATAPSVVAGDFSSIRVAWLRADASNSPNPDAANKGSVGTQLALHVTRAACSATSCAFPTSLVPPARDTMGRRIYGERPRLVRGEEDAFVVMRGFRFEAEDDEPVQQGDPIGTVVSTGDLLLVTPNFVTGISRVLALTADGAMHMSAFAAYNPAARSFVTGTSTFVPEMLAPLTAALKATGYKGQVAYSKAIAAVGPIELRETLDAPDLAVEAIAAAGTLAPNAPMTATVRIGNRAARFVAARDGNVQVQLRFDSPGGALLATAPLADLAAGGETEVQIPWTAPAAAHADEAHVIHAVLATPDGFDEITDDNNARTFAFDGLPVPRRLGASIIPGVPQVQIGWDDTADARVAGYRIYRQEASGEWMPMGASPERGFLDISASFDQPRTYAISSYSARGIESPLSEPITAMPVPAGSAALLIDGFEDAVP